ncbi:MAG: alpha/beta fold hydrolase [Pirellulales bacterium]|nr:alpha/beta fold hydrolase [Pirellulales bacterium]
MLSRRSMGLLVWSLLALAEGLLASTVFAAEPTSPPFYPDKTRLLVWRDAQGKEHPISSVADWQIRRAHIRANMELVMGTLPDASRAVPLDVRVVETIDKPGYRLRKITFAPEADDRVPAWLLLPNDDAWEPGDKPARKPAILCLHQTTRQGKDEPAGQGGLSNLHYAQELAERGYVTLAVDYPNFGEYTFDPYARGYASATMKGIWNHRRAIDLLQSLDEVDPERLGVIGHSLGGHNSMFVAAFDERIKCIVSCCGFCSFRRYYDGDLAGWSHQGYMPRIREVYHTDPARMPFDFTEIVGLLAPRAFLAVAPVEDGNFAVAGVRECIAAAQPVYKLYEAEERLAADYPPGGHDFPPAARERAYRWFDKHLQAPQ